MPDTSLASNLDEIANRLKANNALGIKEVYTITGSSADDGDLRPIPASFDSLPIAVLWFRGERVNAGNTESAVDDVDLLIFAAGADGGFGYSTLLPYLDLLKAHFRSDLDNAGRATRVLYKGAAEVYPEEVSNARALVLPVHLEITREYFSHDYSI